MICRELPALCLAIRGQRLEVVTFRFSGNSWLRGYNVSMNILFLHGWQSMPGGIKPTLLVRHGHEVINPALDDDDFDAAFRTAYRR